MLVGFAEIAIKQGQLARGLQLAAAAAVLREMLGIALPVGRRTRLEHQLEAARQALGPDAAGAAWHEGRALTPERAITVALDVAAPPSVRSHAPRENGLHREPVEDRDVRGLHSGLRAARRARGLSLAAVGALFGVSHVTVSRWETGAEPGHTGTAHGRPIPADLMPLLRRWIEGGAAPTAAELAARTRDRPGVHAATGKPWKHAAL